jgi:multidrug efflux pump subunit AcrB
LVVPYLQFAFLKPHERVPHKFNFESVSNAVYERILKVCFKFPKTIILLAIVCVVVGVFSILERPIKLLPIAQRNQFSVEIFLPTGTSIERTSAVADSIERVLKNDSRVVSVTSFKGMSSPRFHLTYAPQFGGTNFAQFIVNTTDVKATDEIIEKYADHFDDAFVRFKQLSYSDAMSPIEYRLTGNSQVETKRAAEKIADYLRTVPEFYMVRTSLKEPLNGVDVKLNEGASKLGVNQVLTQSLLTARYSGGLPVASLWEGDRNVPVVLKGVNADSADYTTLANEKVATFGGLGNAPLRQIADLEPAFHDGEHTHRNGFQVVTVSAELAYGKSANSAARNHLEKVREIAKTENVHVEIGGEGEIVNEQMPRIIISLVAAIVIIFFILLWHFKKISTALLLVGSLSLCAFGTGMSMFVANLDFSVTCVLGIVSLLGIMVRNGIIMIDYAEELKREEHCDAQTAIFNSALRRMRPIFLTSAAASVGVIPMIMGGSSLWMPMGVVICFGTLITMCLILTVLPVLYWKVSGVRFRMRKKV